MKRSCISKMADRPRVLTRSGTGLALTFDTRLVWAGAIDRYCSHWRLIMEHHVGTGSKVWGMQVIFADALLDAGADADPDIIMTPLTWTLDRVITGAEFTSIATAVVNKTDLRPVWTDGMTFRQMLVALANEIGLAAFDPDVVFA